MKVGQTEEVCMFLTGLLDLFVSLLVHVSLYSWFFFLHKHQASETKIRIHPSVHLSRPPSSLLQLFFGHHTVPNKLKTWPAHRSHPSWAPPRRYPGQIVWRSTGSTPPYWLLIFLLTQKTQDVQSDAVIDQSSSQAPPVPAFFFTFSRQSVSALRSMFVICPANTKI